MCWPRIAHAAWPSTLLLDAVEIHLGHNYLASAFRLRYSNHVMTSFGGSLQNR